MADFPLASVNPTYLHAAALLDQLAASGVRRVVISPGARSTPLALVAASLERFQIHVLIDERSAAFFALGLAKTDGVPAALICTSGTAGANYYPAVIEAAQSQVPLIVLTADRPLYLRHTGAAQTIDQARLFGTYPRAFVDLPEARADLTRLRAVQQTAAQAYARAVGSPAGPVHINVPLEEPLAPVANDTEHCAALWAELQTTPLTVAPPPLQIAPEPVIRDLSAKLENSLCGLIVCGPGAARTRAEAEAIFELGKQLGWPILADVASGLRFLRFPVMPYYDLFLREEMLASLAPDRVLAFGSLPVSKALNRYLDRHAHAHTVRIQPHTERQDPAFRAREWIHADVAPLCRDLARRVKAARDSLLWDPFQRASYAVQVGLERYEAPLPCEVLFVRAAIRALPDGANLVLANSLSVRYADALAAAEGKQAQTFVMRGANGIDGTLSHAAGLAAASQQPTLLVTGDLAFCHDLNGLMAAVRFAPQLQILLLNNNGGGIFHLVDVREHNPHFELLHGTPHNLNLEAARGLFGLDWQRVDSPREAAAALQSVQTRPRVVEVQLVREQNARAFQTLIQRLTQEAARA